MRPGRRWRGSRRRTPATAAGQLVPHSGVDHQPRAGHGVGGGPPTLRADHHVAVAVQDKGRHPDGAEVRPQVPRGPLGGVLSLGSRPGEAGVVARHGHPEHLEVVLPVGGVGGGPGDLLHGHHEVGHRFGRRRPALLLREPPRPPDQRQDGPGAHPADSRRRRGHDGGQRQHAVRVLDGHQLRDHAAERGTDHVGGRPAGRVEHRDGIAGHVPERVRSGSASARGCVEVGGQPDVAVVEADDGEAAVDELATEAVGPADHLRAEAHDQQERFATRLGEDLEGDLDATLRAVRMVMPPPLVLLDTHVYRKRRRAAR